MVEFAVVSYRRADIIATKTLALLARLGVLGHTAVFLSDPGETSAYRAAIGPDIPIHPGEPGCAPNKNAAIRSYPRGTQLVIMDDDVRDIVVRRHAKLAEAIQPAEFAELVSTGFFEACGGLWGLGPVPNARFMAPSVSHDLRLIVGPFTALTTRDSPRLEIGREFDDKEDHARTLAWYVTDGYVTRLNYAAPVTSYYHGRGGLVESRTIERTEATVQRLLAAYPGLVKRRKPTSSGYPEVRLRDTRSRA